MSILEHKLRILIREALRSSKKLPSKIEQQKSHQNIIGNIATHVLERVDNYARAVELDCPSVYRLTREDHEGPDRVIYVISRKNPKGDREDNIIFNHMSGSGKLYTCEMYPSSISPEMEVAIAPLVAIAKKDWKTLTAKNKLSKKTRSVGKNKNIVGQIQAWTLELVDNYERAVETGHTDPAYFDREMWDEYGSDSFFYVIERKHPTGADDDVIIFTSEDGNFATLEGGRVSRKAAAEIRPLLAIAKSKSQMM